MAKTGKLSPRKVATAKGPAVLHDGGGLYLRVSAPRKDAEGKETNSKSWVFRFQLDGKRRDMGLGPYPDVSLAAARAKAERHRRQRQDGADPLEAQKAERQAHRIAAAKGRTFRECAADHIAKNRAGWRNAKHAQQWENTLETYAYPILGGLPASGIDTGLVLQVLEQEAPGGTTDAPLTLWASKPETANRVRGRIEAVLDSAKVRGFRDGPNPAQWRGNLALLLPARAKVRKVQHHPALPFDDLPVFMKRLRQQESMSARALEFTILAVARTGETLGGAWREIKLEEKVWIVPAERMKAGKEHRVPLSDAAIAVLEQVRPLALSRSGKLNIAAPLFPGPRPALPLSNMALLMLLRRMKRGDLTAHGFRSTFSDWAAERTAYPREVVEMALAHAIEDKTEAAYRRGTLFDKRRKLMDAWAAYCASPAGGKVTPIRRRA